MSDRVIVAIPTFRRPQGLKRLLDALAAIHTDAAVSVLVADNDAEGHAGLDQCNGLTNYRWPIRAVIAPERGIAQVRNVLIAESLKGPCDFVAMIDDDEWPDRAWLENFLKTARATAADVLQGSILFQNADGGADGLDDIRNPSGPIAMLQGAGNLLIARQCLADMQQPWFDPAFALSGGEDREFFVRLAAAGKRFAWADDAVCRGVVPQTRASLAWSLKRAYSIGNSDMRVLLKHRHGPGLIAAEAAKIAGALLLSPLVAVILAPSPNRRAAPLRKLFRALGKLSAMFGAQYKEYAVIHGE